MGEISEPFKSDFGYHILIVEKVKGKERDVRHLLLQPEIDQKELDQAKDTLSKIREDILKQKITFEDAVLKYTDDKDTRLNKGFLINPMSSDTHFELTRMDPELYARVSNLKPGEFSEVFYDETQQQQKMYKFLVLKSKTESHIADLSRDYVKIKDLALQKKKAAAVSLPSTAGVKLADSYKLKSFDEFMSEASPAWQRKEGKNPEGGLNKKGIASYRKENPGSNLSLAVTTKPSELKKGSKSANRRKSFCSRMSGMKKKLTSAKTANDPDSRINKSLRKWNC